MLLLFQPMLNRIVHVPVQAARCQPKAKVFLPPSVFCPACPPPPMPCHYHNKVAPLPQIKIFQGSLTLLSGVCCKWGLTYSERDHGRSLFTYSCTELWSCLQCQTQTRTSEKQETSKPRDIGEEGCSRRSPLEKKVAENCFRVYTAGTQRSCSFQLEQAG